MPSAFVMLHADIGFEGYVFDQLRRLGAVEEAYVSYGVYDLIVKVKAGTLEELKDLLTKEIRGISKIRKSLILIENEEE